MLVANMREYFRESLQTSMRTTRTHLSDTAQAYLVNLLAEFARAERAFAGSDQGGPVFVDLLVRAQESEGEGETHEALKLYKHMGDSTLYLSGFFSESVEKRGNVDYYVSLGGSAYDAVARLMRPTAASSSALFAELAHRFKQLVDLLEAMSLHGDKSQKKGDAAVLALVERYQRTGSKEVLAALRAEGVVLRPGLDGFDDDDGVH